MAKMVRVLSLEELPPGTAKEVAAGEVLLAVFNVNGIIYAIEGLCPHAGGSLGEGRLEDKIVTCPRHGLRVDVTTGCHDLSDMPLRSYRVELADGEILVEI